MAILYFIGALILALLGTAATFVGGGLAMDRYSGGAATVVTALGVSFLTIAFVMLGLQ